ncbi:unnamed protein product [Leuciscus chuanchicus]
MARLSKAGSRVSEGAQFASPTLHLLGVSVPVTTNPCQALRALNINKLFQLRAAKQEPCSHSDEMKHMLPLIGTAAHTCVSHCVHPREREQLSSCSLSSPDASPELNYHLAKEPEPNMEDSGGEGCSDTALLSELSEAGSDWIFKCLVVELFSVLHADTVLAGRHRTDRCGITGIAVTQGNPESMSSLQNADTWPSNEPQPRRDELNWSRDLQWSRTRNCVIHCVTIRMHVRETSEKKKDQRDHTAFENYCKRAPPTPISLSFFQIVMGVNL